MGDIKKYECSNCDEVMAIKCSKSIDHCPCCGMSQSLSTTDKPLPENVSLPYRTKHKDDDGYDGCGATYEIVTAGCVEYCPSCNQQWG